MPSSASLWDMTRKTFQEYSDDRVPRLSAALAYYAIFSIAPLLIIAVAAAGLIIGQNTANYEMGRQLNSLFGENGAKAIQGVVSASSKSARSGVTATIIGVVILILGSTGAFAEMQDSLNVIWDVQKKSMGIWGALKTRFWSFLLVLGIGLLLLVSTGLSVAFSAMMGRSGTGVVGQIVNQGVSLVVYVILFAMIYRILPDTEIRWRDVWVGAILTAVLFAIGRYLVGLYLGRGSVKSVFGAAGSLVAVLVWIYYSAQILFIGAEFTQVWARQHGSAIVPSAEAEPVATVAGVPADKPGDVQTRRDTERRGRSAETVPGTFFAVKARRGPVLSALLAGVAVGRLLMPRKKNVVRTVKVTPKPEGHRLAAGRIVEPGWVTRHRRDGANEGFFGRLRRHYHEASEATSKA